MKKPVPPKSMLAMPLDAFESVINVTGGGEKLMLADVQLLAGFDVNGDDMAGAIAAEGDLAGAGRFGDKDLHAGDHAFEGTLHGPDADRHAGVLPKQHMMLEVDAHAGSQLDGESRNQFAIEVIGHAGERFIRGLGGQGGAGVPYRFLA